MLAAPATELCIAPSPWSHTLGTWCLLLPLILTHFMTPRLRVMRLNTPLGRYGCARGGGSMWEGWGFAWQHPPCLLGDAWLCRVSV